MKNKFVGGFTLVELMITVAIIAIIAAIAYPSYQEQVRETRRSNAQADLLELSSYMERLYTQNFSYAAAALPFDESPKQGNPKFYDLDLQNVGANAYTLRAIPKGGQAGDRCGTMTLNEVGQRTPANDCW
ncbi:MULTISPECIES: type IV pilin protein [unclassified Methylophaga]|jgi:type IV pilus assembly protein PilE|uniref:type IV pilin protein n=1 Tax=unclassified Methylophaga TaxID=2629249 RepID=UPI000C9719E2|nr:MULTISPECIES: type IV pilin protein [unclassified Methylophaga]MAK67406.1 pilus assembly protein PilE [Methylophaga sp.]MAY16946.1 pilus assembly protein PilE [Methylophaga sp.]HAO24261.1 pilus assembly protein PilE [Methylophaga sp.]HCD03823.1 pilus assembly protein PilE [Methylophaga sp.]|tara:strand:+ start:61335 stop:61724 length:390 start_codon:yes stop_codon:yes gene_type:complete